MALALYKVLTPYALTVSTMDTSGNRQLSVSIPAGETFLGDTSDPYVISYLANSSISLLGEDLSNVASGTLFRWDESGQKANVQTGVYGSELVYQLYQAYINYWNWC